MPNVGKIYKTYHEVTKAAKFDDETQTIKDCVFSTADEDRSGDTINQDGWILDNFKSNPIGLFNHRSGEPVAKILNIQVKDGKLVGDYQFAQIQQGKDLYSLYKGGFMNAFSVGFSPEEYTIKQGGNDWWGPYNYMKQELLEVSCVSIPCNAGALAGVKGLLGDEGFAKFESDMLVAKSYEEKVPSQLAIKSLTESITNELKKEMKSTISDCIKELLPISIIQLGNKSTETEIPKQEPVTETPKATEPEIPKSQEPTAPVQTAETPTVEPTKSAESFMFSKEIDELIKSSGLSDEEIAEIIMQSEQ